MIPCVIFSIKILKNFKFKISKKIKQNQYLIFFKPLIWPDIFTLKLLVILSLLCIFVGIILNVYVPIYSQKIVDRLTLIDANESIIFNKKLYFAVFYELSTFLILKTLQGVMDITQNFMWIKVEQNATKNIQTRFFKHIHEMSVQWQHSQKAENIIGTLERGCAGSILIMEQILFAIIPSVVNVAIAVLYLSIRYNWLIGLSVIIQIVGYIWATLKLTEWRSRFQKSLNSAEDQQKQQIMESLLNFETVKIFNNENYEERKYLESINKFQKQEFSVLASLNILRMVQLFIINFALFTGSFIIISLILNAKACVGDYVLFTVYMAQLSFPLNYLGGQYRSLRISFINLEYMLNFLKEAPEVLNSKIGIEMDNLSEGIEIKNLNFNYKEKTILQDFSMKIPARKTVALVGESGMGKSTIVNLLTRLIEPQSGSILFDGQSVNKINIQSLRKLIGIVPQNIVLFHDTIMNNLKYAKLDATYYEVILASEKAQIHEAIMKMPLKYDTIVGDRGLSLSGGEKQRIALAKIFLRNSPFVILDEATSSLDAKTEAEIQSSFKNFSKNKTALIITHRLKNIQNADEIYFLKNGEIIECGTHLNLLQNKREYYSMWRQQEIYENK